MPPEFFPAIFIDEETNKEIFCRTIDDVPDGRYIRVKEYSIVPNLCKCEETGDWKIVYKHTRCKLCHGLDCHITPENVEKMLKDIYALE